MRKDLLASGWTGKRIVAMLIFGAIILVFVLFGIQGKHTAIGVGAAARVNDTLISVSDLRAETNRVQQMYAQIFGGALAGDAQRQYVTAQAMENLIEGELISQSANQEKVWATDAEIRDFVLTEMPVFQEKGQFDKSIYVRVLEANHLTPTEFEEKIRKERRTVRSRDLFQAAAEPSALDRQHLTALKNIKMNIAFAKLDVAQLGSAAVVSDAEVGKSLADAAFLAKAQEEYKKSQAEYATEEQVQAQHILIKFKAGDAASEAAALAKIQVIGERAKKEDFAKLAKETSEDAGSKAKGGELGSFGKGRMVPEFDKAAFGQEIGVVGAPVKSQYGYHLIKVLKHQAATNPNFEDVKIKVARKLLVADKIQNLEQILKEGNVTKLDEVLKSWKVSWEETGWTELGAENFPKLGSRVASQEAFGLSEAHPVARRLIQEGSTQYVLKFKGMSKEAGSAKTEAPGKTDPKAEQDPVLAAGRERGRDLFTKWIEEAKKSASVERNQLLLRE
jgi:parvulin-like peptidyl-prolyl isomerase